MAWHTNSFKIVVCISLRILIPQPIIIIIIKCRRLIHFIKIKAWQHTPTFGPLIGLIIIRIIRCHITMNFTWLIYIRISYKTVIFLERIGISSLIIVLKTTNLLKTNWIIKGIKLLCHLGGKIMSLLIGASRLRYHHHTLSTVGKTTQKCSILFRSFNYLFIEPNLSVTSSVGCSSSFQLLERQFLAEN